MDSVIDPRPSLWWYGVVLLRWRRFIVSVPLVAAALVATTSLLSTRRYVATATILASDATGGGGGAIGQIASQLGVSLPRSGGLPPQFYADLVTSRSVLRDLLFSPFRPSGAFSGDLLEYLHLKEETREHQVERGLERLTGMTSASVNRATNAVRIDVSTPVPGLSVQLANRVLALLNESNTRRRQAQAQAEEQFIESQLADARHALREAEDAVARFNARNRSGNSPDLVSERTRLEREAQLQQQLYLALAQGYQQARVESVRNTPVITVIDAPDVMVEAQARGTVRKSVLALLLGSIVAITAAFAIEHSRQSDSRDSAAYGTFAALRTEALRPLRRLLSLFRRTSA